VLLAGEFAWRGELAPHALLRRSPGVGMAPCSCGPRSPRSDLLVQSSPRLETESTRANEQVVRGEEETPRAGRKFVVRGGDSSCGTKTCHARQRLFVRDGNMSEKPPPSWSLVGEASYCSETRHLASNGLDKDPQSSLY
jgi:hypothetical protein